MTARANPSHPALTAHSMSESGRLRALAAYLAACGDTVPTTTRPPLSTRRCVRSPALSFTAVGYGAHRSPNMSARLATEPLPDKAALEDRIYLRHPVWLADPP
jgi:hypothetical protein